MSDNHPAGARLLGRVALVESVLRHIYEAAKRQEEAEGTAYHQWIAAGWVMWEIERVLPELVEDEEGRR